jgi:hypothetical protein
MSKKKPKKKTKPVDNEERIAKIQELCFVTFGEPPWTAAQMNKVIQTNGLSRYKNRRKKYGS